LGEQDKKIIEKIPPFLPHEKIINNPTQNVTETCLATGYETFMNNSIYANLVVKTVVFLRKYISGVSRPDIYDLGRGR
jgi:hypothetical protein